MKRFVKNYIQWMGVKSRVNNKGIIRSFKEGEVWWAAVGENIGVEIDGKNEKYSRPIIILKKHSNLFFTAVPLTSQAHKGTWYTQFIFHNKEETAVLVQTKPMDVTRLYERMGKLSKSDYNKILNSYLRLFQNKNVP